MSETNPQIEEQLDKLATICCSQLDGGESTPAIDGDTSVEALLKSLLMSGFARKGGTTLQVEIENRVKDKCRDPAMHRGGAVSSLAGQIQKKFDEMKRWETNQPEKKDQPKSANISSATDA